MNTPQQAFIEKLKSSFPHFATLPMEELVSENMISYFNVELSSQILKQAQDFVRTIYKLRQSPEYLKALAPEIANKDLQDPGNKSIMMSYDFHIDENQNLRLIEVNTNAAFLLLGQQMYLSKNIPTPLPFDSKDIQAMILEELRLQKKSIEKPYIAITDEAPTEQRMYIEFMAYNELFKSWGWNSEILDYKDLFKNGSPDFIYNRYTDFFLTDSSSQELRKKFLDQSICLSPNPFEYLLLADKQRMIEWVSGDYMEEMPLSPEERTLIQTVVPQCFDLTNENAQRAWEQRKKLFFKPKNAFGSKQSYKGASISRKNFDEITGKDIIAQEYIPAPEVNFATPEGEQKFKFDLRFYAYQDQIQLVLARIYQGQVTNLRTPYGGFAPVIFKD